MYIPWNDPAQFADAVGAIPHQDGEQAMILLAAAHADALPETVDALNARDIAFFGAVFPGLIADSKQHDTGAVVVFVPVIGSVAVGQFSNANIQWHPEPPSLASIDAACPGSPVALTFVDFWGGSPTPLLNDVYERYANRVQYFGAGAGFGPLEPSRCLFTPAGIHSHRAILAVTERSATLGMRHGWERFAGPFVATRTKDNVVQELSWERAAEVYRGAIQVYQNGLFDLQRTVGRFSDFALSVSSEGREDVIRHPLEISGSDELVCLSDIPENAVLHIATGTKAGFVSAAREAISTGCSQSRESSHCLIFDCYSRTILMGSAFEEELVAASEVLSEYFPATPALGALALGEIVSDGTRRPDFHNKTFAFGLIHA